MVTQLANRHDRVQHRAWLPESGAGIVMACGAETSFPRADESHAVRFVGDCLGIDAMHRHQVQHPWHRVALRARPAGAENRLPVGQYFGLHEKIAESRRLRVSRRRREHYLRIAVTSIVRRVQARLVMRTRRNSMSSSGETVISVCVSKS